MKNRIKLYYWLLQDGGTYHIEISPLICSVNQWTGFYMIRTSIMKELRTEKSILKLVIKFHQSGFNVVET